MVLISDNLKQSIRKNVNFYFVTNLAAGVIFVLIGIVVIGVGLVVDASESRIWIWLAGVVMLAIGVGDVWYYWKTRVDIVELLESQPERVVWVYKRVSTGAVHGVTVARFYFVVFGLDNKRRVQVRLPARDADRLIEELVTQLPRATFGYSAELERRYKNNPQDLRK